MVLINQIIPGHGFQSNSNRIYGLALLYLIPFEDQSNHRWGYWLTNVLGASNKVLMWAMGFTACKDAANGKGERTKSFFWRGRI